MWYLYILQCGDGSLSTGTIILIGVIYSMFVSSVLSLVITFAPDKVQSITFWTMGSLAGRGYVHVLVLLGALVVFGDEGGFQLFVVAKSSDIYNHQPDKGYHYYRDKTDKKALLKFGNPADNKHLYNKCRHNQHRKSGAGDYSFLNFFSVLFQIFLHDYYLTFLKSQIRAGLRAFCSKPD